MLNKVPNSRRLLRPLFSFFSNFDDLWLYNYVNATYNPVMQSTFDLIQKLEEEKWELVKFRNIWEEWMGMFEVHRAIDYFNSTERVAKTSTKFLSIEN